jgi:integrase/recombinase XerD
MKKELQEFINYLEENQYRPATIEDYQRHLSHFIAYLTAENQTLETCDYNQLLSWIKYLKEQKHSLYIINRKLTTIRIFYNYLITHTTSLITTTNPAQHLYIKGLAQHLPHNLLSKEQLENIYTHCPEKTIIQKRNKLIVSLYVCQALRLAEIENIRPEHINLKEGTLYIPKNSTTNTRTLVLEARQILPLNEYIEIIRPQLLQQSGKETDKLFFGIGNDKSLPHGLTEYLIQLRKTVPELKNFLQIRSSVIALWTTEKNIREVQYKAGHYYLSTTEAYKRTQVKDLKEAMNQYHPLK